ncbi:hypothetical protein [Plantactinospora sp. B5E13]|uniref:hypothetical protein n=1 Tax=Plantactinospora sp. B5E13 TaxID=3153758 RepID=UPI00325C4141
MVLLAVAAEAVRDGEWDRGLTILALAGILAALFSTDRRAESFLWLFLLVALVYEGSMRWFLHRAR